MAKRIRLLDEENPAIRIVGFVGGSKSIKRKLDLMLSSAAEAVK